MEFSFAAGRALGKLSKWLRILGFDTLYESYVSNNSFFENLEKGRILLTRREKIRKAYADHKLIFIVSNNMFEQLKQVINETGMTIADTRPFSRCILCNLTISTIGKENVYGLVPDYIWETNDKFHRCGQCKRIYWSGSHTKRSLEQIKGLFAK